MTELIERLKARRFEENPLSELFVEAVATIESQASLLREAREALEPFAKMADEFAKPLSWRFDSPPPDDLFVEDSRFRIGDLRRARQLISRMGG